MHRRFLSPARRLVFLPGVLLALAAAPGCELATHFGDFQQAADTGASEAGASDAGDAGRDAALDSAVDVGPMLDAGADSGTDAGSAPTHRVTVTITGPGTASLRSSDSTFTCASGTCTWDVPEGSLTVQSTPSATSVLASWDGACTGTAIGSSSCTIDVMADVALGATYHIRQVTLDVGITGVGTVTSTTPASLGISCTGSTTGCSATVDAGTSITLHAVGASGYNFAGWTLPSCTGTGDCSFTIAMDTHVDATFTDGRVVVGVARGGDGMGTITSDVGGISCGASCSALYTSGTHVVLTAAPAQGSDVTSWTNCPAAATGATCAFDVPASGTTLPTITANFTLQRFTLTVRRSGSGSGTITSGTPPISCGTGAGCLAMNVGYGTSVTLTEAPSADSTFGGWSGAAGCGAGASCTFTVTGDTTVTGTFALRTVHVTFAAGGTGSGQILTDDGIIATCTASAGTTAGTCEADYPIHSVITVRGNAATGSMFTSWASAPGGYCSGGSSTTTPCTFMAEEDVTITTSFSIRRYDLVLTATNTGAGSGTVAFSTGSVGTCASASPPGNTCTNNYAYNTMVTLTASASTGSFGGWGGDCVSAGTSPMCTVTMLAARNVTASFVPPGLTLSVTTSGTTTGTVTDGSGMISCGSTCSAVYASGSMVTLTAAPNSAMGYVFGGWGGACAFAGMTTMCTLTISSATSVVANFVLPTRTVTVTGAGPLGSGAVTDGGGNTCSTGSTCVQSYPLNSDVLLTATPVAGYTFVGWTGCPLVVGGTMCRINPLVIDTAVTATFAVQNVNLQVTFSGNGSGAVTGAGLSCHQPSMAGDVCSVSIAVGSTVSLTATPITGSTLTVWGGACSGSGGCTFVATAGTTSVTATFSLLQYQLTVARQPTSSAGTVVSTAPTSPTINCGGVCTQTFDHGTLVRLQASANAGYRFASWSVSACGTAPTCDVTVTSTQTVTANFVPVRTLQVTIPGSSTVGYVRSANVSSVSPTGLNCTNSTGAGPVTCTAEFDVGAPIRLTSSDPTYPFYGVTSWSFSPAGPSCGTGAYAPECLFTMPAGAGVLALTTTFGQLGNIVFLSDNQYQPGVQFIGPGQADVQCRNEAMSAGLPGSMYVAFLSTTSTGMMARLNGLAPPPQGFVRLDGRPIASSITQLFGGALTHPIHQTATGSYVPDALFWSQTNDSGAPTSMGNACNGWAGNAGAMTTLGHAGRTTRWASDPGEAAVSCAQMRRLVCVQADGGSFMSVRPPAPPSGAITVFTTAGVRGGDQGIGGMDSLCASEASAVGLTGTFVAFVSSSAGAASTRTTLTGPLVRTDGWTLGPMSAFTSSSGQPLGTFAVSAGGAPTASVSSWTGMPASGASGTSGACADFTDSAMIGDAGFPASADIAEWAAQSTSSQCNRTFPVMCIQR